MTNVPGEGPQPLASSWRERLLADYPWLVYLLPIFVFFAVTALESSPPEFLAETRGYPTVYILKIALVAIALWFVSPGYRAFPLRVTPLSLLVGAVGAAVWIGLCQLDWEERLITSLGWEWLATSTARMQYDPFANIQNDPPWLYAFLTVRLFGLVLVVPVMEEFFLRGFVMRIVSSPDLEKLPIGPMPLAGLVAGTVVPLLMHPATEALAPLVWFTGVTLWMCYTRSIWDCIVVHVVTNLGLGVYVLAQGDWRLW
jgi:CAAX prenyl protease-like protein